MSTIPKDPFSIILTSVGVELLSFRKKTGKITNDEEEHLTSAIVERVVRKLKEYGCYQLATDGREELEKENSRLAEDLVKLSKEKNRFKEEATKWLDKSINLTDQITALQSQCTDVDSLLLPFAKEKDLYVDFSDKTYDGDKEAPMDRIGLLSYLISQCTEKEKLIEEMEYEERIDGQIIENLSKQIEELKAENERLKEQYGIMDGRRERAIKSLEESEKQFEQLQEAYNKLIGGSD